MEAHPLPAVVALSLVLLVFAGCIGDEPMDPLPETSLDGDGATSSNATAAVRPSRTMALETELGALSDIGNATREDWFLMAGASGPEGNITGFEWVVPEGALIDRYINPICLFCARGTTVHLEVAPVVPMGADENGIIQFVLAAFRLDEGAPAILGYHTNGWWQDESLFIYTGTYDRATLVPFSFRLGIDTVKPGDRVYFVLVADSEVPSELGMAFRVLDRDRGCFYGGTVESCGPTIAGDFESFRAAQTAPAPCTLPRTGEGAGYAYALFYDSHFAGLHYTGWTKDVDVTWGLPPQVRYGGLYDITASYTLPAERGWGLGFAYAYLAGTGEWSYKYAMHGLEASGQGLTAAGCADASTDCLYSRDGDQYSVQGEGMGPGSASYHVRIYDPSPSRGFWFEHLDLAVTLSDLLGIAGGGDGMDDATLEAMIDERVETDQRFALWRDVATRSGT